MTERPSSSELRPGAFAIAYRMLGSVAEAEDVVQEAMLRLHSAVAEPGAQPIESPQAWLATVVVAPCAGRAAFGASAARGLRRRVATRAARRRRTRRRRPGDRGRDRRLALARLPRPAREPDPGAAGRVSAARRLRLSASIEVADIVGTSTANARQLASSARREVEARRPRFESSTEQRDRLADSFFAAIGDGELGELEALLADDVELHGDGGGKVPALARFISGRVRVARTMRAWMKAGAKMGESRSSAPW